MENRGKIFWGTSDDVEREKNAWLAEVNPWDVQISLFASGRMALMVVIYGVPFPSK